MRERPPTPVTAHASMIDDAVPDGREPDRVDRRVASPRSSPDRAPSPGSSRRDGTPIYLSPAAVELHTGLPSSEISRPTTRPISSIPTTSTTLAHSFGDCARSAGRADRRSATALGTPTARGASSRARYTNLLDDPDIAGVVLDVDDVTDRADAEAALRASEARHRKVIDSLAEAIILSGDGGRIVQCNPAAVELLGVSEDEILRAHRRRTSASS